MKYVILYTAGTTLEAKVVIDSEDSHGGPLLATAKASVWLSGHAPRLEYTDVDWMYEESEDTEEGVYLPHTEWRRQIKVGDEEAES